MSTEYSRLVSVEDLSKNQLEYHSELADIPIERVRKTISNAPIIEIGRVDYETEGAPLGPGENAIIDPCPFCGGRHTHGFQDHVEGQGQVTARDPHCDECDDDTYWLVWRGKGSGEWVGDPKYTQSP